MVKSSLLYSTETINKVLSARHYPKPIPERKGKCYD